jgi:hypothetical protein
MVNQFLNRVWNLRAGELGLVLTLGFILSGNAFAQKMSEITSLSNFLSVTGAPQFLILIVISNTISIALTALQVLFIDNFDRDRLIAWVAAGLGGAFLVLRLSFWAGMPSWLNYSLFYLISEQQYLFFPTVFWLLANDALNISQSKRIFPTLASWGFFGNFLGIGVAIAQPTLSRLINARSEDLLILNVLLYGGILLIIKFSHFTIRRTRQNPETLKETLGEGWEFVREIPAFRYLTLAILAMSFCEIVMEFNFYDQSKDFFANSDRYQRFLGLFALGRMFALMLLQGLGTPRIIQHLSLKRIFFILPLCNLANLTLLTTVSTVVTSTAALTLQKLAQYGIDDTARKSFQGLVPEERRGRVSLFMDNYLIAIGSIVGAVMTGGMVLLGRRIGLPFLYTGVAIAVSGLAFWAVLQMNNVYDTSLLNWRLKRRQRNRSVLDKLDF